MESNNGKQRRLGRLGGLIKGRNRILKDGKSTKAIDKVIAKARNDIIKGDGNRRTGYCIVCEHPKLKEIEAAMDSGISLRVIEEKVGISRTTLSRHNSHRTNVKGVEILDEVLPTAKSPLEKQEYSIENVADIISGLSELVKKLRLERDSLNKQVVLLAKSLNQAEEKYKEVLNRGNNLAYRLNEAQILLASDK